MAKTITDRFLESLSIFSAKKVPENVVDEVKSALVDYIGCTVYGAFSLKNEKDNYLSVLHDHNGEVPLIGCRESVNPLAAAMLNGTFAHFAELDDGQRFAMLHLGAPVFSALLSVAYTNRIGFANFIKGVVVGYEATIRLASAIQPGHKLKGYHATGTCGTIGSALGAAAALEYDISQWKTVISAAATDAAGILQLIDDGSELKPYNIGRASAAALNAVCMGMTGLNGPGDVLGGKRGFFRIAADEVDENYLINGFLPLYGIQTIYKKPYVSCRHCHGAIEAALNIRKAYLENDLRKKPAAIEVYTYGLAVKGHEHREVMNAGSAKMSIPYSVAAALLYGEVNVQQFAESCLEDEELNRLIEKVSVFEDESLSKLVPQKRPAVVKVFMPDGQIYESRVDYPLGEPENKLTREMIEDKYASLMRAANIEEEKYMNLLGVINKMDTDFDAFLKCLKQI